MTDTPEARLRAFCALWHGAPIFHDTGGLTGVSQHITDLRAVLDENERLQRTIAARDRRIARLVDALNDARAKGYVTAAEEGPQVVLSDQATGKRTRR